MPTDAEIIDGRLAALEARDDVIASLRRPWRAVDDQDWQYIASIIPDGGRGRFWKSVLAEMRAALGPPRDND